MANPEEGIAVRLFDRNKITLDKEIGSGSFGKVYLATIQDSKLSPVAIKVFWKELKKGEISQTAKDDAYEELLKLAVIDHENIVKLHGIMNDGELPWLVFEFMRDGNLLEFVLRNDNIKEKTLVRFCRDICCGMAFLHNHKVLHKDLAARNILLNGKSAKIADLGLSSFLTDEEGDVYALNGKLFPYRHAARECVVEQVFTFESDVWSFGVLMYEVFTGGNTPYGKHNKQPEVRRFIVDRITPLHIMEPHCSTHIFSILKNVLNPIIENRPTFDQLHNIFQKMLTGKPKVDQHENSLHDILAFSTFHKIKANGLSNSINNLRNSISDTSSNEAMNVLPAQVRHSNLNNSLLVASHNSRSSSTPNIVDAVNSSKNSRLNELQAVDRNFLSVRSTGPNSRRHSEHLDQIPLVSFSNGGRSELHPIKIQKNSAQPVAAMNDFDDQVEVPRRRALSSSRTMNNPLLEGFVQNRFTRKS